MAARRIALNLPNVDFSHVNTSLESIERAKLKLAADAVKRVEEFRPFFEGQDSAYASGLRQAWDQRMDIALAEILASNGEKKVYGPLPTEMPDTTASIAYRFRLDIETFWNSYVLIDASMAEKRAGCTHQEYLGAFRVLNQALFLVYNGEIGIVMEAAHGTLAARSGEELNSVLGKEFARTQTVFRALEEMENFVYRISAQQMASFKTGSRLLKRVSRKAEQKYSDLSKIMRDEK